MNADASPTFGWAAICFLPVLLLGVSSVILLVVLLRKRAARPRRRTLNQWSNPGVVWWFVAAGVVVAAGVGGLLFALPASSTATLKPKSHIVNGEEQLVQPSGPFDREASFVLVPIMVVVGVVGLGLIGSVVVGVLRLTRKRPNPRRALLVAPLILTPDPTPETAPNATPPFNPGPWITRGELLGVVASVVVGVVLPWAAILYVGPALTREDEVWIALTCLIGCSLGLFGVYVFRGERRRPKDRDDTEVDGYAMHVKVRARMGLPPAMTRAEWRAKLEAELRQNAAQEAVEPPPVAPPPPPPPTPAEKSEKPPPVPGEDYSVTLARFRLDQWWLAIVLVGMMGVLLAGMIGLFTYGKTTTPDEMIVPVAVSLFLALGVLSLLSAAAIYTGYWAIRRWVYPMPKGFPAAAAVPLFATPPTSGDCPACLSPIPADSPHGLCPRCLIRGAMPPPSSTRLRRGVSPIEPPTAAEVNEFFPHLEVLELIGAGGMGAVYKARQPTLDRIVALKIVQSPRGDEDPVFAERFAREARAMAKLDHPSIVTIHESGQAGGLPFLVMEYVDGVTLREAMANRLLTALEALAVIPQVCDALEYAHRAGIVHRDIKPENILLDQTGRVKIADFGLAKLADPKNVTLTRTQQAMGTPHYMAPEQWEKPNEVDHRADIYAVGVVLYELLTGELPLGRFALPSEKGKGDAKLDAVVVKALTKDPAERYQQAGQMKAALSGGGHGAGLQPAAAQDRTFRAVNRHLRFYCLGVGVVLTVLMLITTALTIRDWNSEAVVTTGGMIAAVWLVALPLGYLTLALSQRGLMLHVGLAGVCRQHGAVRQLVPWAAITRVRVSNPGETPRRRRVREMWDEAQKHARAGWVFRAFSWAKPGPSEPTAVEVFTDDGRALWLREFEPLSEVADLIAARVAPGVVVERG